MTTATFPQDVVGVFANNGGTQLFTGARSMRVAMNRASKTMQHPLETGASVIDHRIVMPTEGQLLLILPSNQYRNLYSVIKGYFNSGELLTIQTRADSFANMFISDMPHEETPEMMDAVQMVLRVQEAVFFKKQVQTIAPRSTSSASTTKRGEQAGRQSSVAYDLFKK